MEDWDAVPVEDWGSVVYAVPVEDCTFTVFPAEIESWSVIYPGSLDSIATNKKISENIIEAVSLYIITSPSRTCEIFLSGT